MRWVMKLLIVAGLGWAGYWFIGAKGQEKLLAEWLENSRALGWEAETGDMDVTGFPNRFDTIISDMDLLGPRGDWGWHAEEFQIFALSYKPNHLIFAWPGAQVITHPQGQLILQGEQIRGSMVVKPNTALPLERLRLQAEGIALQSSQGWSGQGREVNIALFEEEGQGNRYRFGLDAAEVTVPPDIIASAGGLDVIAYQLSRILATAFIEFELPIDRHTLESGMPAWKAIEIERVVLRWGRVNLEISGVLRAAGNGYIDGQLRFQVENWQMLFAVYEQISRLRPSEMNLVRSALQSAASGDQLDFSLRFDNGRTYIGPFSIGDAPVNPFF